MNDPMHVVEIGQAMDDHDYNLSDDFGRYRTPSFVDRI